LKLNEKNLGISCSETKYPSFCFEDLIIKAYEKYGKQVVILIDEYDKPILDNIENTEIARQMREELKNFYSVIKGADEYIRFAFLTGVSKFSKVSLFSGLNNLNDITVDKNYATICGYTQDDIETSFAEHLRDQNFDKIREWYNGYSWLGESVYNPFDILLFIQKGFVYDNYWFSTATPTFLLKLIEKNQYFLPNLENIVADRSLLDSFDVDNIRLETLMWQTGYLTIGKYTESFDGIDYVLKLPNKEVQISLMGRISEFISKIQNTKIYKNQIYHSLTSEDIITFKKGFVSLFASIPYNLFTNNRMYEYEGYYVSVFYAYLKALGIKIIAEDITNKGRIDLTLNLPNAIYVMEFKTDGSDALAQIKSKNYHEKYLSENKPIYLIGIEFDTAERNISNIAWEKIR
ncbi:MAG: AAA family ATPase, partial [Flexistipes sinusarabici]